MKHAVEAEKESWQEYIDTPASTELQSGAAKDPVSIFEFMKIRFLVWWLDLLN